MFANHFKNSLRLHLCELSQLSQLLTRWGPFPHCLCRLRRTWSVFLGFAVDACTMLQHILEAMARSEGALDVRNLFFLNALHLVLHYIISVVSSDAIPLKSSLFFSSRFLSSSLALKETAIPSAFGGKTELLPRSQPDVVRWPRRSPAEVLPTCSASCPPLPTVSCDQRRTKKGKE